MNYRAVVRARNISGGIIVRCWAATLAGMLSFASVSEAREPLVLTRTGPWILNENEDSCDLVGQFGANDQQIIMKMVRFQPGDPFYLTFYGKPMRTNAPRSFLSMAFGPGQEPTRRETLNGNAGGTPLRIVGRWQLVGGKETRPVGEDDPAAPTPITPEQEIAIRYLDLTPFPGRTYRLETGSMGATMAALRTCMDKLVSTWGFDPAQQAALSRPATPLGNPGDWITSLDYPSALLSLRASGIVHFRLDIDETGSVAGCHVQTTTKPAGFDDPSCRLIQQRAKFDPALDAAGQPVKSYYVSQVRWIMGG